VTLHERFFSADTMKNMLNFMYHGEYHVHSSETTTKLDVLAHLFCYAVGESYLAKNLSDHALARFEKALHAVTPKEFAELVDVIASSTEVMPVHGSIRNVALHRLDVLAESESFVNVMGGKHLSVTVEQKDADGGETAHRNLQAATQLATLSAHMFRLANMAKARTTSENARLSRRLKDALATFELFRSQTIQSSSSLHKSEDVHGSATDAIKAAQQEAREAQKDLSNTKNHSSRLWQELELTKLKLAKVEVQSGSFSLAQTLEKTETDLEILQNDAHNDRRALGELRRSIIAKDLSLKQLEQQLAAGLSTDQAKVDGIVRSAKGDQKRASLMQRQADEKLKLAVQEQERYTKLQLQLRKKDEQAKRDLAEAKQRAQRASAEKLVLLEQLKGNSAASLSRVAQQQREDAMLQLQGELSHNESELAKSTHEAKLSSLEVAVLREQVKENSAVVLNPGRPNQAQIEHFRYQEKNFHAQQINASFYHTQQINALQDQLRLANLQNFTMQRSIDDLHTIILNNASGGQTVPGSK
jgi:hypothetical protein